MLEGESQKRLWMRLTRVCNQRCLFCHDRDVQDGSFADFESLRRELAEGRASGLERVVLSGGEPTIHPRYLEIVSEARALGFSHIQTITNGRRLCYEGFFRRAVGAGLREVTFSLHGHTPELHDRLTRVPGSFLQALAGLGRALAQPGLIVSVDVVINRLNLPHLRRILEFYAALGVREFDLLALVPFGDAWKNHAELFCDFGEPQSRDSLFQALELSRRPGLRLWTNRLRAEHLEGHEALIQPPDKILDEVRGRQEMFAGYLREGRMLSCRGPQCRFCFMRDFCEDLIELKDRGGLHAKRGPLCRPAAQGPRGDFIAGREMDISEYARYFLKHRNFAKGSSCAICPMARECDGIPVGLAKESGFPSPTKEALTRG